MTPASASRCRVAAGSASSQVTSVVAPRGATVRPRSASASASRVARPVARAWMASNPAPSSTRVAASEKAAASRDSEAVS